MVKLLVHNNMELFGLEPFRKIKKARYGLAFDQSYHFVFQSPFKLQASLTGASPVDDHHSVSQRGQGVETQVLYPLEGVIHQLDLWAHTYPFHTTEPSLALAEPSLARA